MPNLRSLVRPLLLRSRHATMNTAATGVPLRRSASSFRPSPGPPRLPPDQQAEFERLQRKAGILPLLPTEPTADPSPSPSLLGASSRHVTTPDASPSSAPPGKDSAQARVPEATTDTQEARQQQGTDTEGVETSSGGVFRGAAPEFAGDINPKTGEVGGPKNEPLRWGSKSDWSYNGRVTDF